MGYYCQGKIGYYCQGKNGPWGERKTAKRKDTIFREDVYVKTATVKERMPISKERMLLLKTILFSNIGCYYKRKDISVKKV